MDQGAHVCHKNSCQKIEQVLNAAQKKGKTENTEENISKVT